MEPFASPIHIPIFASRTVRRTVLGGHLLAASAFLSALPLDLYSIGASLCVLLSLAIQVRSDGDLVRRVHTILLRSDDNWSIVTHHGEILKASLLGGAFVSRWMVILWLKPHGQKKVRIVLTRENTDEDAFRRLFVRLSLPMSQTMK